MGYYDGDPWSNHILNEIKCGECEQEYDQNKRERATYVPPVKRKRERINEN
jgi:hypothetical protein